jgi:hypothetical protein
MTSLRLSLRQVKEVNQFQSWNDHFILTNDNRFFIFGEGRKAYKRCLVIEGQIQSTITETQAIELPISTSGRLKSVKTPFEPQRKIEFFEEKTDGKFITQTLLQKDLIKDIRKTSVKNITHIRFMQKDNNMMEMRLFDARKYYSRFLLSDQIHLSDVYEVRGDLNRDIVFYMRWDAFKSLPADTYTFNFYDNEFGIFEGHNNELAIYTRDQRLGNALENRLDDISVYSDLMILDPSKDIPTRNNWTKPMVVRN